MSQRQDRQPQTAGTRRYSPEEDLGIRRTLVSPTRCSCGGQILEAINVWGMLCGCCRYDHALRVYRMVPT